MKVRRKSSSEMSSLTNADKKDCCVGQTLLHPGGAGGERVHGLHQFSRHIRRPADGATHSGAAYGAVAAACAAQ